MTEGACTKRASNSLALGWHADWVETVAKERALLALFEMQGGSLHLSETASEPWEKIGLAFAADVSDAMSGIEEAAFIRNAQLKAIELYIRHLHHLLTISSGGGHA